MARIFRSNSSFSSPVWQELPLVEGRLSLPSALLINAAAGNAESWMLLCQPSARVRVNGEMLSLGARMLRHKDEILVAGERFFFSTERVAVVEPLPALGHAVHCARCKQSISEGTPAVRCPGCGAWHMQSEEFPCWTYSDKCSLCEASTEMGAGLRWSPGEEGWS